MKIMKILFLKLILIKITSHIFFFENSALKFSQDFNFGTDLIISDISKVTALDRETIENILQNSDF